MTIWAFVSDVHGNWPALQRAVALARERGARRFAALGDFVGRGEPDACVAWLAEHADLAVVGNRDLDHLALVAPALQDYLRALPRRLVAAEFVLSHGDAALDRALASADARRGFQRAYATLRTADRQVWFFGHTHHARVWCKPSAEAAPLLLNADTVTLDRTDPARCYFVNVGTTGRPRGGCGPASFTLYDTASGRLERLPVPAPGILERRQGRTTERERAR